MIIKNTFKLALIIDLSFTSILFMINEQLSFSTVFLMMWFPILFISLFGSVGIKLLNK